MKIIFSLLALIAVTFSSIAATAVAQVVKIIEKDQLFNAGEWQIEGGYVGRLSSWRTVQDGAVIGLNYLPHRNFGIGAEAQVTDFSNTDFDRIGASLIGRLPFESLRLAPEARVGFLYDLENGNEYGDAGKCKRGRGWDVFAGAGAEFRITKALGLGAELRWVFQTEDISDYYKVGLLRLRVSF